MVNTLFSRIHAMSSLVFVVALVSCEEFVEVGPPKSKIENEVVFSNDVTATSAVLGIYSNLLNKNGFSSGTPSSVLALAGLSGDELVNYARDPELLEFENNAINPANSYVLSLWSSSYRSIYQANAILEGIEDSKGLSVSVRDQLKGEALFVRAFCYFYLVNLYGDVPLVLTTNYQTNSAIARTGYESVYGQILVDLESSRELLAAEYAAANSERVRPNKFTASALLARVYLYLNDWKRAELAASEVINNDLYSLVDSVQDVFLMNSKESIWQLRPVLNGNQGYTYEARYFSPASRYVLKYNVLRPGLYKMFESGDRRFKHWIEYIVKSDTIYFPRKYKQDVFSENLSEYSSVFRLAEQYLIRAEARVMQDNVFGENSAESDVNVIRFRAGLLPVDADTQTEMLNAILRERRVELIAEGGHRWFDLKRIGGALEVLSAIKSDFDVNDKLYPIPASEFLKNPLLKRQNDGY